MNTLLLQKQKKDRMARSQKLARRPREKVTQGIARCGRLEEAVVVCSRAKNPEEA